MFIEAENAGVIAVGQGESLFNSIGLRRDMDKDNQFSGHAVYPLFLRQAEMDVRLHEVLHYQEVQQVTALVNALVGLVIPLGGAAVTNVISGGAAILNDFQVCGGLVESLLGVVKDGSDVFGSGRMVDRFVRKSNAVLSVEEWMKLPAESRKVVEDAARNFGLSIDELREKLQAVAEMQSSDHEETPSEQVLIEEIDDEGQAIDECEQVEVTTSLVDISQGIVQLHVESPGADDTGTITFVTGSSAESNEI